MTNILIIEDRFAALTQRIKSSSIVKIDSRNKFQNKRSLSFQSRFKTIRQRDR